MLRLGRMEDVTRPCPEHGLGERLRFLAVAPKRHRTNRPTRRIRIFVAEDPLYKIVEDSMCIGCDICQAIPGDNTIRVTKTESGYEHPVVVGDFE